MAARAESTKSFQCIPARTQHARFMQRRLEQRAKTLRRLRLQSPHGPTYKNHTGTQELLSFHVPGSWVENLSVCTFCRRQPLAVSPTIASTHCIHPHAQQISQLGHWVLISDALKERVPRAACAPTLPCVSRVTAQCCVPQYGAQACTHVSTSMQRTYEQP
jgi:hypothetical protein